MGTRDFGRDVGRTPDVGNPDQGADLVDTAAADAATADSGLDASFADAATDGGIDIGGMDSGADMSSPAPPNLVVDRSPLRFVQGGTRSVMLTNVGGQPLQVYSASVEPSGVGVFYGIEAGGVPFTGVALGPGQSTSVDVSFSRPAANNDPSIGFLRFEHDDVVTNMTTDVALLGDEGDVPVAQLAPDAFTMLAVDGNSEGRSFAVYNRGTAPLDITGVSWMFSTGSNAEFSIMPQTATIAAGDVARFDVFFTGSNATPDVGLAVLETNGLTSTAVSLRALDTATTAPIPAISFDSSALLSGEPTVLSAQGTTPMIAVSSARWALVERPSTSSSQLAANGANVVFTPDVAGSYTIVLTVADGDREAQASAVLQVP